ncbi:MAG: hypothetical protein JSS60_02110 [Verrucomicrobia bacterium]|nr:hypothetical protein [Verrucomicrobiota bacterium]
MSEKLYANYRKWRSDECSAPEGIVVATDLNQEWLLSWWWENYRRHNSYPVAFVDMGMSEEIRSWCRQRGELIRLQVADIFVAEKEKMDPDRIAEIENVCGTEFWSCRSAWFKKPLACLQSPFLRSIWIDLDCQIRGSLKPLFDLADGNLAIAADLRFTDSIPPLYNSGVVAFKRGLKIIEEWASLSLDRNRDFFSDDDILNALIRQNRTPVAEIPSVYNWSRCCAKNPEAVVLHWHGPQGKSIIRHQIMQSNLSSLGLFRTY